MEPIASIESNAAKSKWLNPATLGVAILTTLDVCLTVFLRWKTFGWIYRFLCSVFLAVLLAAPLIGILHEKRARAGKKVTPHHPADDLLTAYLWLLLATLLFGR